SRRSTRSIAAPFAPTARRASPAARSPINTNTCTRSFSPVRRVLFISPHFPPDSTAGTHRARLLAPRLPQHGWEPTVLTVDPADYEGPLDPALADSVPGTLRVVRARAWPARLTRSLGVGDLGLRAFEGLWREATHLLTRERFDAVFITIYPTYP